MRTIQHTVVGLSLLALLAACSQTQDFAALPLSDADVINESAQADLALTASLLSDSRDLEASGLETNAQAWKMPRRMGGMLQGLQAYIPAPGTPGCDIKMTPADFVDVDQDGVAKEVSIAISCKGQPPAGSGQPPQGRGQRPQDGTFTIEGTVAMQDTDDNQKDSGLKASFTNFHHGFAAGGNSMDRTLDGTLSLDKTNAALYVIAQNYTQSMKMTRGGTTQESSSKVNASKTYAPDDTNKPWAAGTLSVDKATPSVVELTRNGQTRSLAMYTDPTLHWNRAACGGGGPQSLVAEETNRGGGRGGYGRGNANRPHAFDAGAKEVVTTAADGTKSTLRIAFSGCGQMTVTKDGQPVQ